MTINEKVNLAKQIVNANVGKFITVDFIKKDGTLRHITCHKSKVLEASCTGNNAEATAKRKATLKATNQLCVEELTPEKTYQFRTVNLEKIVRIAAGGVTYSFK